MFVLTRVVRRGEAELEPRSMSSVSSVLRSLESPGTASHKYRGCKSLGLDHCFLNERCLFWYDMRAIASWQTTKTLLVQDSDLPLSTPQICSASATPAARQTRTCAVVWEQSLVGSSLARRRKFRQLWARSCWKVSLTRSFSFSYSAPMTPMKMLRMKLEKKSTATHVSASCSHVDWEGSLGSSVVMSVEKLMKNVLKKLWR
mmetsp:Transcript_57766/g.151915  ORF Transcript_57766/g.151915 Transcript_57766/m.151915 type:complete len:202 (+) Transcript_57766:611-1216(+)